MYVADLFATVTAASFKDAGEIVNSFVNSPVTPSFSFPFTVTLAVPAFTLSEYAVSYLFSSRTVSSFDSSVLTTLIAGVTSLPVYVILAESAI